MPRGDCTEGETTGTFRRRGMTAALAICVGVFWLATVGRAEALDAATCDAYAATAVVQAKENVAANCGFTGGAWSVDANGHHAWCLGAEVTEDWLASETNARSIALAACRANPPPPPPPPPEPPPPPPDPDPSATAADCDAYAASAVVQQDENVSLGCGFQGGAWQAEAASHRNWCSSSGGIKVGDLNYQTAARETALAECRANPPPEGVRKPEPAACDAYAAQAVAQQGANKALGCGLSGDAWLGDAGTHRAWCLGAGVTNDMVASAAGQRSDALNACRQRGEVCARYATLATAISLENADLGCGIVGEGWSQDINQHRAWCIASTYQQALGAASERIEALRVCALRVPGFRRAEATRQRRVLVEMLREFGDLLHQRGAE